MGNSSTGVYVLNNASSNQIGGLTDNNGQAISLGNYIVNNGTGVRGGVWIDSGNLNSILSNSITNNGGTGITLNTVAYNVGGVSTPKTANDGQLCADH